MTESHNWNQQIAQLWGSFHLSNVKVKEEEDPAAAAAAFPVLLPGHSLIIFS